ncbi:uncharacterized protein LY89DRAFT_718649 [Mollisia scopiformis]|uniref:Nephrocystin 3-like N-terminal domain-containing protein n=1 Tax=Mollisia scopiformis TaxID=149040 RepID=A0A194XB02_MOLSC|nr:uncharacterized protein LY89DRAFT_718649 [Mollisia scopiformis]KUJ16932.1 hypothetical protein LY89DRAFT_718649 [Mollisia scopiformis]
MSQDHDRGSSQSLSQTKFGDYARVHQGPIHNNYLGGPESDSNADFLDALSPIDPAVERTIYEGMNGFLPESILEWIFRDEGYKEWHLGDLQQQKPLLWIVDNTGKGSTAIILRLISHVEGFKHQPPFLGYCFCHPTEDLNKTTAHVLEGFLYLLLSSNDGALTHVKKKYKQGLRKSLKGPQRFFYLAKVTGFNFFIDGIDQLVNADRDFIHLLALIRSVTARGHDAKWVITSRNKEDWRTLELGFDHRDFTSFINVKAEQVPSTFSLSDAVDVIESYGLQMEGGRRKFQFQHNVLSSSLDWFRYTMRGNSWLSDCPQLGTGVTPSALLWYRPENLGSSSEIASELGLHIGELFGNQTDRARNVEAYFSFHYLRTGNQTPEHARKLDVGPSIALWSLFTALVKNCCIGRDDLSLMLLDLPYNTQDLVSRVCSRAAKMTEESKPNSLSQEEESVQSQKFIEDYWFDMFKDTDLPLLVDLIEKTRVLPAIKKYRFLLIVDSFHLIDKHRWAACLQLLDGLVIPGKFRVLASGGYRSKDCDESMLGLETINAASHPVSESTELREFLDMLHFDEIHARRDQVAQALPGTNEWLWSNAVYKKWSSAGGFLWISGKAGSGKSVLAKTIRFDFLRGLDTRKMFLCDWFYNRRGHEIGTAHISMLRALVHEIVGHHKSTFDTIKKYYREEMDVAFRCGEFPDWSIHILKVMLLALAAAPSTPETLAIIDALDESKDGQSRKEIIEMMFDITSTMHGRLRLIVLSRPEPQLLDRFKHCFHIAMQDNNRADIGRLVDFKLDDIRRAWVPNSSPTLESAFEKLRVSKTITTNVVKEPATTNDQSLVKRSSDRDQEHSDYRLPSQEEQELKNIRLYLMENSGGVVLWAHLILQELSMLVQKKTGFNIRLLRECAEKLPKELDYLYVYYFESLGVLEDPERLKMARRIFLWVVGTRSRESLQLQDLLDAIAIPELQEITEEDVIGIERWQIGGNWNKFRDIIYEHCGPLVEIVERRDASKEGHRIGHVEPVQPNWTIQLLHQTVRSFLENRTGPLQIDEHQAKQFVQQQTNLYLQLVLPKRPTSYCPILPPLKTIRRRSNTSLWPHASKSLEFWSLLPKNRGLNQDIIDELWTRSAWLSHIDYLSDRPFCRYALKILEKDGDTQSWVKSSVISEDDILPNHSFPLWWAFDSCLPRDEHNHRDYLREFTEQACLMGQPIAMEILLRFMELLKEMSRRKNSISKLRVYPWNRTLTMGAVDAFLVSANDHPTCVYPLATTLAKLYSEQDEDLETSSNVAISGLESIKENDRAVALAKVIDRRVKRHACTSLITPGIDTTTKSSLYELHCKLEIGTKIFKDSKEKPRNVTIGRIHEVIKTTLETLELTQKRNSGRRSPKGSMIDFWVNSTDEPFRWFTLASGSDEQALSRELSVEETIKSLDEVFSTWDFLDLTHLETAYDSFSRALPILPRDSQGEIRRGKRKSRASKSDKDEDINGE